MAGSLNRHDADRPESIAIVCREFQVAQDSGQSPSIEEYLARVPPDERRSLLLELVVLDLEARRRGGEHPSIEYYVARFPEYGEFLRDRLSPGFDSADPSLGSTVTQSPGGTPGSILAFQHNELRPQGTLGRYQLVERLGRGAFGEVWKARDPGLNRLVAVKTLRSDCEFPEAVVRAFLVEGQRLAQLRHPGIVCVYDVGVENGRVYIVSELVDGETLANRLAREAGPMAPGDATELIAQIADAVHHAHLQGIVHRDIKPSNILLDRHGRPLLADFGLAITEEDQLYEPAAAVGTLAYMSPEQFRGESHRADSRADVYSLGVVLYRLLAGRLPFVANSREQWRDQILNRAPRPLRTIEDSIPAAVEAACLKCLSKRVEDRYSTAADLARELKEVMAPAPSLVRRGARWGGVAIATVMCALVAVIVGWRLGLLSPGQTEAEQLPLPGNFVTPEKVLWPPPFDELSQWSVAPDGRTLIVNCRQLGFLKVSELNEGDTELSAEIGQLRWVGNAGLFWGFRPVNAKTDRMQCEQIIIVHIPDLGFVLDRNLVSIDQATGEEEESIRLARVSIPEPGAGPCRMTLKFEAGRLVDVVWDGLSRPELISLTPTAAARLGEKDVTGPAGVFVVGEEATFSKVRWNEELLSFLKPSAL